MANVKTLPNLQALSRSPSPALTLPSEAVLDALKMMLIGASLNEVLTSITRLIEAHNEGTLCSIFLLDEDGLHLRYGVAPNLPQAYQAATDGTCIGPNVGSFCNQNSTIGLFHLWCYGERILPSPTRFPQKAQQSLPCNRTQEK